MVSMEKLIVIYLVLYSMYFMIMKIRRFHCFGHIEQKEVHIGFITIHFTTTAFIVIYLEDLNYVKSLLKKQI